MLLFLLCLLLVLSPVSMVAKQPPASVEIYTDIAKSSGLDFVHFNGMSGEYYFPEMTGQGSGLIDFDNDGDLDVYLVQGNMLGKKKSFKDAMFPPRDKKPRNRLFRNDLTIKNGKPVIRFTDVTDKSGLKDLGSGYGMGVCSADFNNDGFADLYISNYGDNRMLFNTGNGTFKDVTAQSRTNDNKWSTSAVAFDYDRDGWLDLFVANYVLFDVEVNRRCFARSSRRDYCGPASFPPQKDRLFHNKGDGTFEDVTDKMLIDYKPGSGLGVIAVDFNGDGWLDLYVANDGKANQLWINQAGKSFRDDALFSGAALNMDGHAEASMGIDAGDFDCDGDEDLFMTHLMGETNTLYMNNGKALFEDRTIAMGLSADSFPYTSFGTNWVDYDNDGWLDIFIGNGAVLVIEKQALAGDKYPLHQPNQLFHSEAGKRFTNVSKAAGKSVLISEVSRGAAFGDIDNDGDTDILVFNNNGPTRLLRNNRGQQNKWLGLVLKSKTKKRHLLGTRAALKRKGKPTLWRRVRTDGSYCSSNDPRVLFGLGQNADVDSIEIIWPDQSKQVVLKPVPMKYTTIFKTATKRK